MKRLSPDASGAFMHRCEGTIWVATATECSGRREPRPVESQQPVQRLEQRRSAFGRLAGVAAICDTSTAIRAASAGRVHGPPHPPPRQLALSVVLPMRRGAGLGLAGVGEAPGM